MKIDEIKDQDHIGMISINTGTKWAIRLYPNGLFGYSRPNGWNLSRHTIPNYKSKKECIITSGTTFTFLRFYIFKSEEKLIEWLIKNP